MEPDEEHWRKFKAHLKKQETLIKQKGEEGQERANEEHLRFLDHAGRGECYVCKKSLKTFSSQSPCLHWLLRPKGVKKQHILEILRRDGYHRSAAYLRWFANYQSLSRNINDIKEEGDLAAFFHWSCCYEHRKWTFKCSIGDKAGHSGTKHDYPHYHFEMRLTNRPFVSFNDFHVPFTDEDLFWHKANGDDDFPVKQSFWPHGSGMQDVMNADPEKLIELLQGGGENDEDDAVFQVDSFIFSEEGISGDMVADAIEASKSSGKTIAYHLGELGLNPSIIITPARTVPEISERNNPRKKKS